MKSRQAALLKYRRFTPRMAAACRAALSIATVGASGVAAYLLRFDFQIPHEWLPSATLALACWLVIQPAVLYITGWNQVGWHRIALPDLVHLTRSAAIAALLSTTIILLLPQARVPRSVFLLQGALILLLGISSRVAARVALERRERDGRPVDARRALIYGAGAAGQALLRELRRNPGIGYHAVGFVDDDEALRGQIVQGMPVLGDGIALGRLVTAHRVDEILIAVPSTRPSRLAEIVTLCDQAGRPCKTIPGMAELIRRPDLVADLRQVNLEELLGREPVQLDVGAISREVAGRVVLVTGAAGSIGSEICRQLAGFRPRRIIALDFAETPLFDLENEFREHYGGSNILPTIGDVRDEARMLKLMQTHGVEIVFHTAAYKHVPMMERHPSSAIENNVFGTLALVDAAEQAGVRQFVMISTDKAVRPSSVMGATKRLAELIVKSRSGGATRFVSVRFGNVLGSNGSVVPIFERQIRRGGPVTITHPEVKRYFMTIPEAAQLVLQAMALGTSDEIFVLDMGNPIRIGDLARSLIAMHGKSPEKDIALKYTGLRPGEKLFEELYLSDENLVRTVHQKILVLKGDRVERKWVSEHVDSLRSSAEMNAAGIRAALCQILPDYEPAGISEEAVQAPCGKSTELASLIALNDAVRDSKHETPGMEVTTRAWDPA